MKTGTIIEIDRHHKTALVQEEKGNQSYWLFLEDYSEISTRFLKVGSVVAFTQVEEALVDDMVIVRPTLRQAA